VTNSSHEIVSESQCLMISSDAKRKPRRNRLAGLDKLTVNLKPEPMSAEDQKKWNEAARQVNLAAE
jgi:hypothetical protein